MEDKYEMYAVLTAQIKELTERKAAINEMILRELSDNEEEKVETPVGKFTVTKLKTWKYTSEVTKMEENFKALKAKEESTGEAKYTEKLSLRFTPVKL